MKKLFLVFILLNFTTGCVWYEDNFHHDNGRKCGQREDHCNVGHKGYKNKYRDDSNYGYENENNDNDNQGDNGYRGDNGNNSDNLGKKGKRVKTKTGQSRVPATIMAT